MIVLVPSTLVDVICARPADLAELRLQRLRDGGGHGLGTGARVIAR